MLRRLILAAASAGLMLAPMTAARAQPAPAQHVDLSKIMGRWYEVARVPNMLQRGCEAGASDWTPQAGGFAVVQSCHKGAPNGPLAVWKARATVADRATNAKFKMSFFGGLVSQEYWVLEQHPNQGWLVLATANGKYLWLMSQTPTLPAAVRATALQHIREMGFDVGRLEFPLPAAG